MHHGAISGALASPSMETKNEGKGTKAFFFSFFFFKQNYSFSSTQTAQISTRQHASERIALAPQLITTDHSQKDHTAIVDLFSKYTFFLPAFFHC